MAAASMVDLTLIVDLGRVHVKIHIIADMLGSWADRRVYNVRRKTCRWTSPPSLSINTWLEVGKVYVFQSWDANACGWAMLYQKLVTNVYECSSVAAGLPQHWRLQEFVENRRDITLTI